MASEADGLDLDKLDHPEGVISTSSITRSAPITRHRPGLATRGTITD